MSATLVLGLGNILYQDEGLGVEALKRLTSRYMLPPEVQSLDGGVLGLDILTRFYGISSLLILDAVHASKPPGSLIRLEGKEIPTGYVLKLSMHEVGFQEVLAVSQFQGSIPERIVIWGIEPDTIDWGFGLSSTIEAKLDELVQCAISELQNWGIELSERDTTDDLQ